MILGLCSYWWLAVLGKEVVQCLDGDFVLKGRCWSCQQQQTQHTLKRGGLRAGGGKECKGAVLASSWCDRPSWVYALTTGAWPTCPVLE